MDKDLRKELEKTVKEARQVAETAATAALEQFGVAEANPYPHLSESERELRRRLRVHGRQLGDTFLPSPPGRGVGGEGRFQDCARLIEEIAYEHWHRMLFARFLAENDLLMYDGVAVTLEDCEELASDEGLANGWELAARLAAKMLPQIFRIDSPVFQLSLPPEHQHRLERLLAELPSPVFTASDSLGWVYQFWQAKKKDEVNASEVKIGARELPAVTQLFTEPYMVSFLLDNALGAWWAARRLTEKDYEEVSTEYTESSEIEKELRRRASIPGVSLEYLRFVSTENTESTEKEENKNSVSSVPSVDKKWVPAAGTFDGWPEHLADLKTLDPCCGSGHFLVAAFLMLVPMRMALEGLSAKEAVAAVMRDNIHGLELDQRCVELAAFALALTAWKYPNAGGYRVLPELHLACSGLSVSVAKEEWKLLGLGKQNLTIALDWLHDTFKDAPVLGSLLNPAKTQAAKLVQWQDLAGALEQALKQEQSEEQQEAAVVAQGLAKAATLMAGRYHWVITNVPYLVRGKQHSLLQKFAERNFSEAKNDLATVFLDRCLDLCSKSGICCAVTPQNWLYQSGYKKFREKLFHAKTWNLVAQLGSGAFETISGEVVKVIMVNISNNIANFGQGGLFDKIASSNNISCLDISEVNGVERKSEALVAKNVGQVRQDHQLSNPDSCFSFEKISQLPGLSVLSNSVEGLSSGDLERFISLFWEVNNRGKVWEFFQRSPDSKTFFSGCRSILRWEGGAGVLSNFSQARVQGNAAWGKKGVLINVMSNLNCALYMAEKHDKITAAVVPIDETLLPALWAYCSAEVYNIDVRKINPALQPGTATLVKVPFDLDYWTQVAAEKYPHGLPKPYTDDPTQWIFHGHPCGSVVWDEETKRTAHGPLRTDDTVLQVAVARLLGYRWPAELDA
ncbi:SAM-dependent DNA methyltransferase, partial [Candidatus Kaiserbacteria bacterium]|nr:SAM-dependent DNA methyltransferase [Candidatus Kaiserbacteria bacterium]